MNKVISTQNVKTMHVEKMIVVKKTNPKTSKSTSKAAPASVTPPASKVGAPALSTTGATMVTPVASTTPSSAPPTTPPVSVAAAPSAPAAPMPVAAPRRSSPSWATVAILIALLAILLAVIFSSRGNSNADHQKILMGQVIEKQNQLIATLEKKLAEANEAYRELKNTPQQIVVKQAAPEKSPTANNTVVSDTNSNVRQAGETVEKMIKAGAKNFEIRINADGRPVVQLSAPTNIPKQLTGEAAFLKAAIEKIDIDIEDANDRLATCNREAETAWLDGARQQALKDAKRHRRALNALQSERDSKTLELNNMLGQQENATN